MLPKVARIYYMAIPGCSLATKVISRHHCSANFFINGIHLITKIRKNIKNSLKLTQDKILLRKKALVESINNELKNMCQMKHTSQRSFGNFLTKLLTGLIAFVHIQKPTLNLDKLLKTTKFALSLWSNPC